MTNVIKMEGFCIQSVYYVFRGSTENKRMDQRILHFVVIDGARWKDNND